MLWLKIIGGPQRGKKFPLRDGTFSIGRESSNQIQLNSPSVSRLHSVIKVSGKSIFIEDKNSANGTIINGKRKEKTRLASGDKIYLGKFVLQISSESTDEDIYEVDTAAKKKASDLMIEEGLKRAAKISGQITWSAKIFLTIIFVMTAGGFLTIYLSNSKIKGDLKSIALSKGIETAKFLAEKNKLDLAMGNEMLIDVKSVLKEDGVLKASVIDKKGLILAPLSRQNEAEKNKYTLEAVNSEKSRVIVSHEYPGDLYVLAYPIRTYNEKKGTYKTIGAAKIVFAPEKLIDSLPSGGSIPNIFVIIILGAGIVAFMLVKRGTLNPLRSILDKTEQAKIEGYYEPGSYPREFAELSESIQRLASNLAILKSSEESSQKSPLPLDPQPAIGNDKIDAILSIIPEPVLIFDKKMTLVSINEQAVFFFGLQGSNPVGNPLLEIINEDKYRVTVEDLIEEAQQSRDRVTNKTLDEGLKTFEFSLSGIKDNSGKIEFGILLIETI